MRIHHDRCDAITNRVPDFVDVTDAIHDALARSQITDGQVSLFCSANGCALVVNERETGLLEDLRRAIERVGDGNAGRSFIGTTSLVLPAAGGRLKLGTWQRILLVELERATDRSIVVQIVGE